MAHHHMIKKVKKVTKEKIKYRRISISPSVSHKKRKRTGHRNEHRKKQKNDSSLSESSSSDDRSTKASNKLRKKHKTKYESTTTDLLKVYERDAEIFQPLSNFVDDRTKLADEILSSVEVEYIYGLFPDLKHSTMKETSQFLSEMLKYMSRERILALLNGTEISSSSATSVDDYEDENFATSSQYSPSEDKNKNRRRQLPSDSDQSNTDPKCLYVTHSEGVQNEITTYGIVDINGDVIPTKKRRSQENKKKVELEEGEVDSEDESCENDNEFDTFGESVAYVKVEAGEERTVTIEGDIEVYSITDEEEQDRDKSAHCSDNREPSNGSLPITTPNCVKDNAVETPHHSDSEEEEEGVIESSSSDIGNDIINANENAISNSPSAVVNISDDEATSKPHQVHAVSSTSNCKNTVELDEGEIEEEEDLPTSPPIINDSLPDKNYRAHDVEVEEEVDEYFDFELVE